MAVKNAIEGLTKLLIKKYDLFDVEVSEDWGRRFAICKECTKSPLCPLCHCVKEAKSLIKEETCPKNLWP